MGKLRHLEAQSLCLQEAVRAKRIGLSKVHGPVNPADLMTKNVDHATQIRLLALMSVEARLGRAEAAPETGEVDEQVCSIDSAARDYNEYECDSENSDEDAFDWIYESMKVWGVEVATDPLPRGGVGDARGKGKEQKEMSPSAHAIRQARFSFTRQVTSADVRYSSHGEIWSALRARF